MPTRPSPDWQLSAYRGQNANMHACEAMLAAYEATREPRYLQRALTLAESRHRPARRAGRRPGVGALPRGPDGSWSVDWDYNRDDKTNIFRPWGYQTGHLTEWAKLLMQLERWLPEAQRPAWIVPRARHFFDTAMARGWDAVHGGLVYGFAPDGSGVRRRQVLLGAGRELRRRGAAGAAHRRRRATGTGTTASGPTPGSTSSTTSTAPGTASSGPTTASCSDEKSPAGKTDYHTMGACYDVLRGLGV